MAERGRPDTRLWLWLAIALILRLGWMEIGGAGPGAEGSRIHLAAVHLAQGLGFTGAWGQPAGCEPVGYPAVLAAAYRRFGPTLPVAWHVNLVLGLGLVGAVFLLARELYDERAALWSAGFAALYPSFVLQTTILAPEALVLPAVVLVLWLFVKAFHARKTLRWTTLAGLAMGGLIYARPAALLFPAGMLAMGLALGAGGRASLRRTIGASLVAAAVLLPWGWRNREAFGSFTLTTFASGPNLWMGNHAGADGRFTPLPAVAASLDLPARDRVMRDEAMRFLFEEPALALRLCGNRALGVLRGQPVAVQWNREAILRVLGPAGLRLARLVSAAAWLSVLAFLALALFRRGIRGGWLREDLALLAAITAVMLPLLLAVALPRDHLLVIPLLIVLGAIRGNATLLSVRRQGPPPPPASISRPGPLR